MRGHEEHEEARQAPLTPAERAEDEKLQALLDQALAGRTADPLPPDFTRRLLEARPFAPWEVRRPSAWKAPLLVLAALVAASAAAFVLPLLRLGPGSAFAMWGWVTVTALARPVAALASALRLLPEAGAAVREAVPSGVALGLGAGALASVAATALLVLRRRGAGGVRA